MKIENLKEGMVIKNYKELCRLLEVEEKTKRSKNFQIKEFNRFFSFHNDGQKIIIDEIFDNPMEKNNLHNSVYSKHLEILLLNHLAKQRYKKDGVNSVEMSIIEIAFETGLCNDEYINKTVEIIMRENPDILEFDAKDFNRRVGAKLRQTIKSIVDSLEKRFIINVKQGYMVKRFLDPDEKTWEWTSATLIDEDAIRASRKHAIDVLQEKYGEKEIIGIKKRKQKIDDDGYDWGDTYIEKSRKIEKLKDVIAIYKLDEFFEIANEYLKEHTDIRGVYGTYIFNFTDDLEENIRKFIKANPEIEKEKFELNQKILEYVDNQAISNYNKSQLNYEEILANYLDRFNKKPFRIHDKYIDNQKILSNKFIKLKDK